MLHHAEKGRDYGNPRGIRLWKEHDIKMHCRDRDAGSGTDRVKWTDTFRFGEED